MQLTLIQEALHVPRELGNMIIEYTNNHPQDIVSYLHNMMKLFIPFMKTFQKCNLSSDPADFKSYLESKTEGVLSNSHLDNLYFTDLNYETSIQRSKDGILYTIYQCSRGVHLKIWWNNEENKLHSIEFGMDGVQEI